jgi:carbon-monoxide dehydrogenase small subunit
MDISVSLTVNGKAVSATLDPRTLLVQLLRERLGLTGTHVGCDTGQCGACTVHVNGRAVKSCIVFAAQVGGAKVVTIEGIAADGDLHPMQAAFRDHHGLQCGFCTSVIVMNAIELVNKHPNPSEETVRAGLEGNFCRCTGYHNIVKAVLAGAAAMRR